jgi:hypothetical protein
MDCGPLIRIGAGTAAELCAHMDLPREARALLIDGITPQKFLEALFNKQHYVTGIEFLAHALPARQGIWWGCLCLQHAFGDSLPVVDKAACQAVVQWLTQPTEANRAAAKLPGEAAGPASAAGALARAVTQTGGNIAPPKAPPMAPSPFAPSKAVANAIKLTSLRSDPAQIGNMQAAYLELGLRIAEGRFIS